jgi:large subunit ribosomal protein L25
VPEITLTAVGGRTTGTRESGRARKEGRIPAVVYGHGMDPLSISVEGRDLRSALTTDSGLNALLELQLDGEKHLAMAKQIQRDPVRNTVIHVDFQIVRRDEIVTAEVAINLVGDADAVHKGNGVVDQSVFALTVHATPDKIPQQIDIDISELAIGDTIRVADLELPEGVTIDLDPEASLVVGQPPQVSDSDLVTEADAQADAEIAEAAGEGGDAAEGGDSAGEGGGGDQPAEDASA